MPAGKAVSTGQEYQLCVPACCLGAAAFSISTVFTDNLVLGCLVDILNGWVEESRSSCFLKFAENIFSGNIIIYRESVYASSD